MTPGTESLTVQLISSFDFHGATGKKLNGRRLLSSGGRVSAISAATVLQLLRLVRRGTVSISASFFGWSSELRRAFSYERAIRRRLLVEYVGTFASRWIASSGVDCSWPVTRRSALFWSLSSSSIVVGEMLGCHAAAA